MSDELCDVRGCDQPKGHNMGKADIPDNHQRLNPKAPLAIRLSPDGCNVAIRNGSLVPAPWRSTNGGYYRDDQVANWYPLVSVHPDDREIIVEALDFRIDQATASHPKTLLSSLERLATFFRGVS
jgi:hypothetical protein